MNKEEIIPEKVHIEENIIKGVKYTVKCFRVGFHDIKCKLFKDDKFAMDLLSFNYDFKNEEEIIKYCKDEIKKASSR